MIPQAVKGSFSANLSVSSPKYFIPAALFNSKSVSNKIQNVHVNQHESKMMVYTSSWGGICKLEFLHIGFRMYLFLG